MQNKLTKSQIREAYSEVCDELYNEIKSREILYNEMEYLSDFISWKNLQAEFEYFRANAHKEENPDVPFPNYVL